VTTLKIAFRNVFRNSRRSMITLSTVAVGGLAILLFGALMTDIMLDFQTSTVRRIGHLTVYKAGYFTYGTANPSAYGIAKYEDLLKLIVDDPVLKPMLVVATPIQAVFGIAGNYDANVSKTFFGLGIIPSDRWRMRQWNDYGLAPLDPWDQPLPDDQIDLGIAGLGFSRILGLCERLNLADCPPPPSADDAAAPAPDSGPTEDFSALQRREKAAQPAAQTSPFPRIDLLSATIGGAPNVVSLYVHHAEFQGIKDLDDNYVIMNLKLAQRLLYGREAPRATGIVLELHHTGDLAAARARLIQLFREHRLNLEVRDFMEIMPLYHQAISFFVFLFVFIAAIISVIVLFTIVNVMSMSVMERTSEIGTIRALGVQRDQARWQFMLEGGILGVFGASLGLLLASLLVLALNHSGLTWAPPTMGGRIPLHLYLFGNPLLLIGTWGMLVILSIVASVIPANRAAMLPVVDALRHV
jgi:putative ABC transport system permease protein